MSNKDATGLVVGGEPRIDFLPPEVKAGKQARRTRRSLVVVVVLVLVACAGGYVFATSLAVQGQAALVAEQEKTSALLAEQAQYAEARTVAQQLAAVKDARLVGTATEILWKPYLGDLRGTLPSGMAITAADVDSISATELAPIPTVPLETERVATLKLTATAPNLASVASWLDNLKDLRGFADVWSTPAIWEGDHYEVEVRLNINSSAYEKRFFEKAEAAEPAEEAVEEAPEAESAETPEATAPPELEEPTTESEG